MNQIETPSCSSGISIIFHARSLPAACSTVRRLDLAQLLALPAPGYPREFHRSQSLQHLRPLHPRPPLWGDSETGQIVCYKNRTYHVSATGTLRHA